MVFLIRRKHVVENLPQREQKSIQLKPAPQQETEMIQRELSKVQPQWLGSALIPVYKQCATMKAHEHKHLCPERHQVLPIDKVV